MSAGAKSRAALFQLSQIRDLKIQCDLHQDETLDASGQPRFSASIAFGSQHAHSGAVWFESGPQAEEAAAGALLAQLHTMPHSELNDNADSALRTAMDLRNYEAVRSALALEVVKEHASLVLLAEAR